MNGQDGENGDADMGLAFVLEGALRHEWVRCVHFKLGATQRPFLRSGSVRFFAPGFFLKKPRSKVFGFKLTVFILSSRRRRGQSRLQPLHCLAKHVTAVLIVLKLIKTGASG